MARNTKDTGVEPKTTYSERDVRVDDPAELRFNRQMLVKHIKKLQDATKDYKLAPADYDEVWMVRRAKVLERKAKKQGVEFQELPPPAHGKMPGRYPDKNYYKPKKGRQWGAM